MDTTDIVHRFYRVPATAVNDDNKTVRGTGHVCVALRPIASGKGYRVGVSFKSPADRLDRDLGRRIADGRLVSRKPNRNFVVRATTVDEAFAQAVELMLAKKRRVNRRGEVVTRAFVPDWLHTAVAVNENELTPLKTVK